jgi:ribose-phosphate pyrophosphokinase
VQRCKLLTLFDSLFVLVSHPAADARLMESMGVDRVIAVDSLVRSRVSSSACPQIILTVELSAGLLWLYMHNPCYCRPDAGGVYRAKKFKEGGTKYEMKDLVSP